MDNDFLQRRDRRRAFYSQLHQSHAHAADRNDSGSDFQPPEEIAAEEEKTEPVEPPPSSHATPPGKKRRSLKAWFTSLTKKQRILLIAAVVVILGLAGFAAYYFGFRTDTPPPVKHAVVKKQAPKKAAPTTVPSTLTGLPVDPSVNNNPVTAVMIENSSSARPQAGIIDAGVVFEAVAEGGITRFITFFQDTSPDYIGPVRSVRPYYIKWANGFDAAIAHVGGSGQALAMIRSPGGKDLDQFFNPSAYGRISSRPAPHNMYSSIPKLRELQIKKGWGASNYTGFARKDKETPAATPTARTIDFNISGALYNSHYDYDSATNSYKRSEGGKPHTDDRSGQQISPKVVIGLVMPQGRDGIYTTYETIGSGHAYIFQDGTVTEGTWTKTSNDSQFTFKDTTGAVIKLNPGKTWISVVGSTDRVSYKP